MNIKEKGLYYVFFIIGFQVWFDYHRIFFWYLCLSIFYKIMINYFLVLFFFK